MAALDIGPGAIVADLGPGAGHFTLRLARIVAPDGVVYALDANPEVLRELQAAADAKDLTTLRTIDIARDRLTVPEPVDLLFVAATYHHLRNQTAYFAAARSFLRPGGRVAILESRREGLLARWLRHHDYPPRLIRSEMARAGFELATTHDVVRGYWFGIFKERRR